MLVLLLCRVCLICDDARRCARRHSGGDGGGSNSPSRKFSFKASTCVAVGYAIPHSAVTVGCRVGLRLPVFSLAALPALRCRTSDIRRSDRGLRGGPLQNVAGYYAAARATSRSPIIVLPVLTWSGATTRNLEVRSLSNPLVPLTLVHYQLYSDIVRKQYLLGKENRDDFAKL